MASRKKRSTPGDRPRQVGARKRAALERARHEARRRLATRALLLVGALVVGTLGVFAFRGGGVDAASSTEPTSFDLPALHGEERVSLASFRGKPVVVNFFASWCTACDFELPGFARVSDELKGQVTFVGVNTLETGDPDLMPSRHGITWWPLARDVGGSNGSGLHNALGGGNSMPLTAFYDADGQLVAVDRAALPEDALRGRISDLYRL